MRAYKRINVDNKNNWTFVNTIIVFVSIIAVIITVVFIIKKFSLTNCKRVANLHELENTGRKPTPPSTAGEDGQVSAPQQSESVNYTSEGQTNSLGQTDATMAWIKVEKKT